jgi:hypothetical protein
VLPPGDFESPASTSSAIPAFGGVGEVPRGRIIRKDVWNGRSHRRQVSQKILYAAKREMTAVQILSK